MTIDSINSIRQEAIDLEANAWFALACAQSYLEIQEISKPEEEFIIYSSMFRDIHAREWSMIFYLLEQRHLKDTANISNVKCSS